MKSNKVISELKKIAHQNGGLLQPETVVEAARPVSSPLHSRFEWDNGSAAHQYRIWQARQLIRVSVELLQGTKESIEVFVSLIPDRERESGGYRIMTDVLSDSQMRAQLLKDALNELEIFQDKYKRLKELVAIFSAIKRVRKK